MLSHHSISARLTAASAVISAGLFPLALTVHFVTLCEINNLLFALLSVLGAINDEYQQKFGPNFTFSQ